MTTSTSSHDGPGRRPRAARAVAVALPLAALCLACHPQRDAIAAEPLEICDGRDDDGNGLVDDLDANGDGLCDCLAIGVLGYPGPRSSARIQAWMHTRAVPTEILADQVLTRELLAGLDVLVVQDVQDGVAAGSVGQPGTLHGIGRVFSDAEVQVLKGWVEGGGGLLTLTGYTNLAGELTNVNRLLAPFDVSYASTPLVSPTAELPVVHWDTAHPLAAGISRIGVDGGFPVVGAGVAVAWDPSPGAVDLGRALEAGRGRVFAWGDEWITFDVEWNDPSFQVERLWLNAMRWLTPPGRCQLSPR